MKNQSYLQSKLASKKQSEHTVYNPQNSLYKKLTRFFSGPIVKWKVPDISYPNGRWSNKYKISGTGDPPLKRKDEYLTFNQMSQEKSLQALRMERYNDFEAMEFTPEINTALDIYAGDIASYTEFSEILKIITPNDEIKEVLRVLFYDVLYIEQNLFTWVRGTCKYGDFFLFLDLDEKLGISRAIALPSIEIERLEGEDPSNPNYVKFQWNKEGATLENFSVAHFRILGDDKFYPYGTSILDGARRIFRQLQLLEDNMMAYRIVRAPERRVFYLDHSGIEPDKKEAAIEKTITTLKRDPVVDPNTGRMNLRYGAAAVENDIFIPITKGSETRVESLPGGQYVGDIDDVKYLRDKLFSALKIPASYLSSEGSADDKMALAQKDIVFARTVLRIQNSILAELTKIAMVHLLALGYKGKDILNFKLRLNNPSRIAEMQELEQLKSRTAVAQSLSESYFSKNYIYKKVYSLNDEEIARMRTEILGDAKFNTYLQSIESGGDGEFASLGDLGGGGGGLGDLGGGEMLGVDSGQPEMPQEPSSLLATPGNDQSGGAELPQQEQGRRMDDAYLTPGAKGKAYRPVRPGHDKMHSGQRLNQYRSSAGHSATRSTMTNIFPGFDSLMSFSKGMFSEKTLSDEKLILEAEEQIDNIDETISNNNNLIKERLNKYLRSRR